MSRRTEYDKMELEITSWIYQLDDFGAIKAKRRPLLGPVVNYIYLSFGMDALALINNSVLR